MKKITCPVCKEEIELGKKFCPECGYKFEYSIVDKTEDKKEETKTNQTKKVQKTNPKEEKRIAIHFILYAINNISKGLINSLMFSIFNTAFGVVFINPITKQRFFPETIILNTFGTLLLIALLCLSVTKNKALNIIGTIITILYTLFAAIINVIYLLYFGISNFANNILYVILSILPILIWSIIQIIYIAKKRD